MLRVVADRFEEAEHEAARCELRANKTRDDQERRLYRKLAESWRTIAENHKLLRSVEKRAAPDG